MIVVSIVFISTLMCIMRAEAELRREDGPIDNQIGPILPVITGIS